MAERTLKKPPGERILTCLRCGGRFVQFGAGKAATACDICRQRCAVEDCIKPPARMTGLCSAHYQRWRKGTASAAPIRQYERGERICKVESCERKRCRSGTYCAGHMDLLWRYGLTADTFAELLASQGGRCAICGTDDPKRGSQTATWTVDHDHGCCPGSRSCRKCIRGLLCGSCNRGLGQFGDDPIVVEAAAAYLRRYERARVSLDS